MRILTLLIILITGNLAAHAIDELPIYKTTNHFTVRCLPEEEAVASDLVNELEAFYDTLSQEFKHNLNTAPDLSIFPDLVSFHKSINCPDAPNWLVTFNDVNTIKVVYPNNPGQTYDSIVKSSKAGLIADFIYSKYPNHTLIPRWLHQGICFFKTGYFSKKTINSLNNNLASLPTLEQLDSINKANDAAFYQINGFAISQSLVEFIYEQWGWESILALLEDYSKFEDILHVSKAKFSASWIEFIKAK